MRLKRHKTILAKLNTLISLTILKNIRELLKVLSAGAEGIGVDFSTIMLAPLQNGLKGCPREDTGGLVRRKVWGSTLS